MAVAHHLPHARFDVQERGRQPAVALARVLPVIDLRTAFFDERIDGHCQVNEKLVDRPPRCWGPARREPAMLGIKNGRQPQLDNTVSPHDARKHVVKIEKYCSPWESGRRRTTTTNC